LPSFGITMVLFMLGISSTMGIYTMLPLYLVAEQGMALSHANEIVGLSRVLCFGMAFLAGWANDRIGAKRTLMTVLFLGGLATILLGVLHGFWLTSMVFVQPLIAVCFFPPAFALLSTIGPAGMNNVAVSLTIPAAFLMGGGAMPLLIGMMGDRGSFATGMIIVGGMILVGALLAACLDYKRQTEQP
jgi:MFS transporter, NNP family, nitrate/nitrite transporter